MKEITIEQPGKTTPRRSLSKFNFLKKLRDLKPVYKLIVFFLVAGIGAVVFSTYKFLRIFTPHEKLDTDFVLISARSSKSPGTEFTLPEPPQVKDKENPINGNLITRKKLEEMQNRKAIAVTMNNHSDARPQHGLSMADIVMEVLAEGGITRYVSIFYENVALEKIGPIRSVRLYMIEHIRGFDDPVLLHEGQAGYDGADFEIYNADADARGYINKNNIKSIQSAGSRFRDMEKAKKSGYVHALYTSGELLEREIKRYSDTYKWKTTSNIEPLKFKPDAKLEQRGDFGTVETTFLGLSSSSYKSSFTYNRQSNSYLRSIAGKPDVDLLTNRQIAARNVIVEWHNYKNANDGHSRIVVDMIGEDKVVVLRDGLKIEGTWKKDSATSRTRYFDSAGEEIQLNRGLIWVVTAVKMNNVEHSKVEFR